MSAPTIPSLHRVSRMPAALAVGVVLLGAATAARAQGKITFVDQVLPLVEQHCAKCHNPDKKKGDLDLTTHSATLKGGGTGPAVVAGNPDASRLIKVLTHAEEPFMPPNKPPLPEKELAVFKGWIAGGLLETAGSKAVAAARPAADLTLKVTPTARPAGPPPMPEDLTLEPVVHTSRRQAVAALAVSPWAPLVAVAGQKQILLYHADQLELLGILPFPDGQPAEVRFSRNGQLLLAGGGHGARTGKARLWQVTNGMPVATLGAEYDTVLAADLSPDQASVALGGPDRLVKVFSTAGGPVRHKMKKHTDWVTAVAFSPDGQMLATADRNGGVTVWDADSAQELFTTAGHKSAVNALSWRVDSKVLASASEDGTVKLWEASEGKQAKTWTAHAAGVLALAYSRDGRLASGGRDGTAVIWDANGNKGKTLAMPGELVTRCAWTHDDAGVVAGDFEGNVVVWDAKSGQRRGALEINPPPLEQRIAAARQQLAALTARTNHVPAALTDAEAAARDAGRELRERETAAAQATNEFRTLAQQVATLKDSAAKPNPPADLNDRLAAARAARETARAATTNTANAVIAARRKLDAANGRLAEARKVDPSAEIAEVRARLESLIAARAQSELHQSREAVAVLAQERDRLTAAIKEAEGEIERLNGELAKARESDVRTRLKNELKTAQAETKARRTELDKTTSHLRQRQAELEERQRNRPARRPATAPTTTASAASSASSASAPTPPAAAARGSAGSSGR